VIVSPLKELKESIEKEKVKNKNAPEKETPRKKGF
jgi:hypothetical protein